MKHNINDRVLALTNPPNDKAQFRIKGQVYVVKAIMYCSTCGIQSINIGELSTRPVPNVNCACGSTNLNKGLGWTDSKYFAKMDEASIAEVIEQAVKDEDYELATVLRDIEITEEKFA